MISMILISHTTRETSIMLVIELQQNHRFSRDFDDTVKPPYSGHLSDLRKMSTLERLSFF